jgi:hypothetical protein
MHIEGECRKKRAKVIFVLSIYNNYLLEINIMDYNNKINETDSIVKTTINEFLERAEQGKKKYGVSLDREDLIDIDYLVHMKEEMMDAILYINKFLVLQKK